MTVNAIPSAVAGDGVVYCVSGYKGASALAISLDAAGDVTDSDKVLRRYGKGTPYVPSPLLAGGRLWFTQANDNLLTHARRQDRQAGDRPRAPARPEILVRLAGRRRGARLRRRSRGARRWC